MKTFKKVSVAVAVLSLALGLVWPTVVLLDQKPLIADVTLPVVQVRIGIPMRLKIPSIAVDAVIEKVTVAKDGSMGVPTKPIHTGWYEWGPRPGETGSAVIDGHVNWWKGAPAVFSRVQKLKPGEKITVQDDQGAIIVFVVHEIRTYDATADTNEIFRSNDGKAHLNLITCDGVWDKKAKQYSKRLVVFADREIK